MVYMYFYEIKTTFELEYVLKGTVPSSHQIYRQLYNIWSQIITYTCNSIFFLQCLINDIIIYLEFFIKL